MNPIKGFFRHMFVERLDPDEISQDDDLVEIAEVVVQKNDKRKPRRRPSSQSLKKKTTNKLIIHINQALLIISIASFIAILVYPIIRPDVTFPKIIENTFSMTIGYFVSATISYLELNKRA